MPKWAVGIMATWITVGLPYLGTVTAEKIAVAKVQQLDEKILVRESLARESVQRLVEKISQIDRIQSADGAKVEYIKQRLDDISTKLDRVLIEVK